MDNFMSEVNFGGKQVADLQNFVVEGHPIVSPLFMYVCPSYTQFGAVL